MKTINIKTIRIDGGTQSRVEINNEIVTEYAEAIKAGAEFPAVVVFNDGVDNWLADGFHRFHAHNQAGKTSIAANVRQGTARDAVLYSLGANGTHGLNRTNADKRKAVQTMLADAEWAKWSNVAVANACLVSEGFVRSLRINEVTTPQERIFTNKHGTTSTMQTANIGTVATPKPTPEIKPVTITNSIEPDYTELDAAKDQISDLQAALVVANMGDVSPDDKFQASNLIEELRAEVRNLELTNKALIISRDSLQNENAQMKRQLAAQRRELDKIKA